MFTREEFERNYYQDQEPIFEEVINESHSISDKNIDDYQNVQPNEIDQIYVKFFEKFMFFIFFYSFFHKIVSYFFL